MASLTRRPPSRAIPRHRTVHACSGCPHGHSDVPAAHDRLPSLPAGLPPHRSLLTAALSTPALRPLPPHRSLLTTTQRRHSATDATQPTLRHTRNATQRSATQQRRHGGNTTRRMPIFTPWTRSRYPLRSPSTGGAAAPRRHRRWQARRHCRWRGCGRRTSRPSRQPTFNSHQIHQRGGPREALRRCGCEAKADTARLHRPSLAG